jgi:hypothetical protein
MGNQDKTADTLTQLATLGAVSGLFGGGRAKKALKHTRADILRTHNLLRGLTGLRYGEARTSLQDSLATIRSGYGRARGAVSSLGSASTTRALEREQSNLGTARASLNASGLGSSTLLANAQRGISADTNRALAAIDESLAGIFSGLEAQQAGMEAGVQGELSRLSLSQLGTESENEMSRLMLYRGLGSTGIQTAPQSTEGLDYSGLIAALGPLLKGLLGGGATAAAAV